jgi:hypothetical protein
MPSHSSRDLLESKEHLKSCQRLADQLIAGRITFEEYAPNVTLRMVSVLEEDLPRCVEMVPVEFISPYAQYLSDELIPVDYMPYPGAFLVSRYSEDVIESLKQQYRPKYIRLLQAMKEIHPKQQK